jgi:hypothetical protein
MVVRPVKDMGNHGDSQQHQVSMVRGSRGGRDANGDWGRPAVGGEAIIGSGFR